MTEPQRMGEILPAVMADIDRYMAARAAREQGRDPEKIQKHRENDTPPVTSGGRGGAPAVRFGALAAVRGFYGKRPKRNNRPVKNQERTLWET